MVLLRSQKHGRGELAPSLVDISSAAPEIRRDAEARRIVAVRLPNVLLQSVLCVDFVCLLQVLVLPLVGRDGTWKRVEGDALVTVEELVRKSREVAGAAERACATVGMRCNGRYYLLRSVEAVTVGRKYVTCRVRLLLEPPVHGVG